MGKGFWKKLHFTIRKTETRQGWENSRTPPTTEWWWPPFWLPSRDERTQKDYPTSAAHFCRCTKLVGVNPRIILLFSTWTSASILDTLLDKSLTIMPSLTTTTTSCSLYVTQTCDMHFLSNFGIPNRRIKNVTVKSTLFLKLFLTVLAVVQSGSGNLVISYQCFPRLLDISLAI